MLPPFLRGITKGKIEKPGRQNHFVMPVVFFVIIVLIGQAYWLSKNQYMFTPFSITRIDCPTCVKIGTVRDPQNDRIRLMCPACFGVGYKSMRAFDDNDVVCVACGGIGRLESKGSWRTCLRCDGRGMHRSDDWKEFVEIEEFLSLNPTNVTETNVVSDTAIDGESGNDTSVELNPDTRNQTPETPPP